MPTWTRSSRERMAGWWGKGWECTTWLSREMLELWWSWGEQGCVMETGGKGIRWNQRKDGWTSGANLRRCFRVWVEGGIWVAVHKGALWWGNLTCHAWAGHSYVKRACMCHSRVICAIANTLILVFALTHTPPPPLLWSVAQLWNSLWQSAQSVLIETFFTCDLKWGFQALQGLSVCFEVWLK